jgi:hypothetical protein
MGCHFFFFFFVSVFGHAILRIAPWSSDSPQSFEGLGSGVWGLGVQGSRVRELKRKRRCPLLGGLSYVYYYCLSRKSPTESIHPSSFCLFVFLFRKMRWSEKLQRRVHHSARGEGHVSSNEDVSRVNLTFSSYSFVFWSCSLRLLYSDLARILFLSFSHLILVLFLSYCCATLSYN